eukprot:1978733-Rhodomonas_salina.3
MRGVLTWSGRGTEADRAWRRPGAAVSGAARGLHREQRHARHAARRTPGCSHSYDAYEVALTPMRHMGCTHM